MAPLPRSFEEYLMLRFEVLRSQKEFEDRAIMNFNKLKQCPSIVFLIFQLVLSKEIKKIKIIIIKHK